MPFGGVSVPGSCHLSLLVDDLPGLHRELRTRGVSLAGEPVPITSGPNTGGYAIYLSDPNGILIELFQPPIEAISEQRRTFLR